MPDDRQPAEGGLPPIDIPRLMQVFRLFGTVSGMSIRGDKEARAMSREIEKALRERGNTVESEDPFAPLWALEHRINVWLVIRRKSN